MSNESVKLYSKVALIGEITDFSDEPLTLTVTTRSKLRSGSETSTKHVVLCSEDQLQGTDGLNIGDRVLVHGQIETLTDEDGREVETVVRALKLAPPPAGYEELDYNMAKISGQIVRPVEHYRRRSSSDRPFSNLRAKVGAASYIWLKFWNALHRRADTEGVRQGAILEISGRLNYRIIGDERKVKLTEINANNPEKLKMLFVPPEIDEFAKFTGGDEVAIDTSAYTPPLGAAMAPAGAGANDDIPF